MAESVQRGAMVLFRGDVGLAGIVWDNFLDGAPYSYVAFSALDPVILAVVKWSDLTVATEETESQRVESLKLCHDYIIWRASENGQVAAMSDTYDRQKSKRRAIVAYERDRVARMTAIAQRGLAISREEPGTAPAPEVQAPAPEVQAPALRSPILYPTEWAVAAAPCGYCGSRVPGFHSSGCAALGAL